MKKLGYAPQLPRSILRKDPNTRNAPYHCPQCVTKQALIEQLQHENAELKSAIRRALESGDIEVLKAFSDQPVAQKSVVKSPQLDLNSAPKQNALEDMLRSEQKVESPKFSDNPTINIK